MKQSKITVIGSLNMDLVVISDEHPQIGETVIGKDFKTTCGGKGGNQAVAAEPRRLRQRRRVALRHHLRFHQVHPR